jgi:hypothetical protein
MKQGSTVCECGRDDVHSSKDCWTIEKLIKKMNTKESKEGVKKFFNDSKYIESKENHQ